MRNIVDHTDFCRACRGRGYTESYEWNIYANAETLKSFTCYFCGGSGKRTVRIISNKGDKQ